MPLHDSTLVQGSLCLHCRAQHLCFLGHSHDTDNAAGINQCKQLLAVTDLPRNFCDDTACQLLPVRHLRSAKTCRDPTHQVRSNPPTSRPLSMFPRLQPSACSTHSLMCPLVAGKIKFVCRWGGELVQDSQGRLAFEGGETRLCTLPKAVRYRDFVTKLRELTG